MPETTDVILELPALPDSEGEKEMADIPPFIHEQGLSRISLAGVGGHEHHVQFGKVLDYSFEQGRHMVSLVESLGVREVTSKAGQAGIPLAGGAAGGP